MYTQVMSYGTGDEYHYDTESRFPAFSDMAVQPLSERVRTRRQAVAVADGVAKGYGPLNVRQTSWPENMAQYQQQGINSQYGYGHHESPVPYNKPLRSDDIDMRRNAMDRAWEESCKAPERPAKTIGRYSEAFSMPDRSTLNPDLVMMFLLFILVIVIAQCLRMVWGLNEQVSRLKEKVARLDR